MAKTSSSASPSWRWPETGKEGIAMGVLSGIRIVEIAGIGPGPFCAMHLADLGADVITVQRMGGPGTLGPETSLNRGKRAIAVDLKSQEGRDTVLRLVEGADALIEG